MFYYASYTRGIIKVTRIVTCEPIEFHSSLFNNVRAFWAEVKLVFHGVFMLPLENIRRLGGTIFHLWFNETLLKSFMFITLRRLVTNNSFE